MKTAPDRGRVRFFGMKICQISYQHRSIAVAHQPARSSPSTRERIAPRRQSIKQVQGITNAQSGVHALVSAGAGQIRALGRCHRANCVIDTYRVHFLCFGNREFQPVKYRGYFGGNPQRSVRLHGLEHRPLNTPANPARDIRPGVRLRRSGTAMAGGQRREVRLQPVGDFGEVPGAVGERARVGFGGDRHGR